MRAETPQISIITPTLNAEDFILRNMSSIHLKQHGLDIEQIVVDAMSSDRTVEIIERFRARHGSQISIIVEKDTNMHEALNKGLNLARGDTWANLNADDEYVDGAIKTVLKEFASRTSVDVVYGSITRIDASGRNLFTHYLGSLDLDYLVLKRSCVNIFIPATFFRKSVVSKVGYFDTSFPNAADYDYLIRVARSCSLSRLPFVLTKFRVHEKSLSVIPGTRALTQRQSIAVSDKYIKEFGIKKRRMWGEDLLMMAKQIRGPNLRFLSTRIIRWPPPLSSF